MKIKIYNRETKEYYYEKANKLLIILYQTIIGRILLKIIFTRVWFTKLMSNLTKSRISKYKIKSFIKNNNIDMSEYECQEYHSFEEFFVRKIKPKKREIDLNKNALISVCDAKLSVYKINENLELLIKNSIYTVKELIQDDCLTKYYENGTCLVFRLTKDDYHHYSYFDNGKLVKNKKIKGSLHTVMPLSQKKYKIFGRNFREYDLLKTVNFGDVIYMEVGALMISKINNYNKTTFIKGEQKGYFSFGASTIILLFKENTIKIDDDILLENQKNIEVKVKLGEKIGCKY